MNPPLSQSEARRLAAKFCPGSPITIPVTIHRPPAHQIRRRVSTRDSITRALSIKDWKTTVSIADSIGLHESTARDHLAAMRENGAVESRLVEVGRFKHKVLEWKLA